MKEGKLSSALQERYGISEENAVGKVLWHSLNENAQIGAYDMKSLKGTMIKMKDMASNALVMLKGEKRDERIVE